MDASQGPIAWPTRMVAVCFGAYGRRLPGALPPMIAPLVTERSAVSWRAVGSQVSATLA